MATISVSLPDRLKPFIDEQVAARGFGTGSEFVRELIRREQDRENLRSLLVRGAISDAGSEADATYFDGLRERIRRRGR